MLRKRGVRVVLGTLLLTIALLGSGLTAGRAVVRETHRHVVVEVFNNRSVVQIFVNCRQAGRLRRSQPGGSFDLGWLEPDDRIFLSATSQDVNPAYGFAVYGTGTEPFKKKRGDAELFGFPAEADAVVFAEAVSAGGAKLGQIGCQPPATVSIPGYRQSADDDEVERVEGNEPSYESPRTNFDRIDAIGSWSLIPLAVLGILLTGAIEPTRRLALAHRGWAGGAIALLAALASLYFGTLGGAALIATLTLTGTLLLFVLTGLLLWPSAWRWLEGAAAGGGAEA